MRHDRALLLLAALATACSNMTPEQQAKVRQVLTVACKVDGVVVPVAQPIVATLGSGRRRQLPMSICWCIPR